MRWVGEADAGVVMGGSRLETGGDKGLEGVEEEDVEGLEAEREALEGEQDVYTRTSRLFMECDNETSAGKRVITWLDKEQGRTTTLPSPPASRPLNPQPQKQAPKQPQPQPQPQLWTTAPAPEPQPSSSQHKHWQAPCRPGPSSTQRTPRKRTTDEIMRHLVGGMAGLAIPMVQDDGGRWRISQRRK